MRTVRDSSRCVGKRTRGKHQHMSSDQSKEEQLDRELIELLNELRVALPGVQVLFAFLLGVPFTQRFEQVTALQKDVYFLTFLCSAVATGLLIAPSAYPARVATRGQGAPPRRVEPARDLGHLLPRARDLGRGVRRRRHALQCAVRGRRGSADRSLLRLVLVRVCRCSGGPA